MRNLWVVGCMGTLACTYASECGEATAAWHDESRSLAVSSVAPPETQVVDAASNRDDFASGDALTEAVSVTTDKLTYRFGEPIKVTIRNGLSTPIVTQAETHQCAIITVYRRVAGSWVALGSCPSGGAAAGLKVAPGTRVSGFLGPAHRETLVIGPIVGAPVGPMVFEGDAGDLPTVKPWQPGDLTWVVPRGNPPELDRPVRLSSLESELGPGEYRVEFTYKTEKASEPPNMAYSDIFLVNS